VYHFTFSDDGAVLKSHLLRGILRVFGRLHLDGRRQLAITAYCVRSFFDAYLKGGGQRSLSTGSELCLGSQQANHFEQRQVGPFFGEPAESVVTTHLPNGFFMNWPDRAWTN